MTTIRCLQGLFLQLLLVRLALGLAPPTQLIVGEGFEDPLGFHDPTPTFSWQLPLGTASQTAYQIEVQDALKGENVWDTGWIDSDQSILIPYGGQPLASRQQLSWRVRFRDEAGEESEWSEPASFELGLLNSKQWRAKWIRPKWDADEQIEQVARLRRDFNSSGKVVRARLYATARGIYQMRLNGKKVGTDAFNPGWTSYSKRIDTQTYDVTKLLRDGENTLAASLGHGWYAGRIGWKDQRQFYGDSPELLAQLEITYEDGRTQTIVTNDAWKATLEGPIRSSSIYDGEIYDARKEMPGWDQPGFDSSAWSSAIMREKLGDVKLTSKPFAPVRVTETVSTVRVTEPQAGRFVFDLGQNIVGWPKLQIPVEKDKTVTIRFAEMLNKDGSLYTKNYRSAKSLNKYTASESKTITWQPLFTFHGFRYVELSGLPEGVVPEKDWVQGLVLHSDLRRIGTFTSSHKKLNQLQSNITWGQRGNFLDIPTDCPQRDERLGWTGDAQAFCPTAMFNYDCHAFWKSWLRSMRDDQFPDGRIPHVIPDALNNRGGSPGWMDAATIIPWQVYVRTGDKEILEENYEMMERLVAWYRKRLKNGVVEKVVGFGDWLQPYAPDKKGETPHRYLATAFYVNSVQILANSARVLGKTKDLETYSTEADAAKRAFAEYFFDKEGKLQNAPETQTAYSLAIGMVLLPPEVLPKAGTHLVRLIEDADGHLRTGFLGTPLLASSLDFTGNIDVAYSVLFKETYPSWFFSINQGATTMWERWNSYSHKDGFGNAAMNSFNHYAYGAIGQFMYERIAGLSPNASHPGYKHFYVLPDVTGPLTSASAELETPYGKASSSWKKSNGRIEMNITVPPNTTATIQFPDGRPTETVAAGTYRFQCQAPANE